MKYLLFEFKKAHDGTIFDCPPDGVFEVPFWVTALKVEYEHFPFYTQYYVYAVG